MKATARKRATAQFERWSIFVMGVLIMSFGITLLIKADLGSAPWDVLHIGLTLQFGLTVGSWSILIGGAILALSSWLMKEWPQIGAFINMVLVGCFIDLFMWLLPAPEQTWLRWIVLLAGIVVMGYGMGLYIAARCGTGPRDSLMIALTKTTGWNVRWTRSIMELIALLTGWFLGGPVFAGTLLFCFGIGPVVGIALPQCQKVVDSILERRGIYENLNKRTVRSNHHDGIS